jgi:PleD family two-component response regulator
MPERLNCLMTISIGGVGRPLRIQPVISLRPADDALYTAKKARRNRGIWENPRPSGPRLSGAELV